MILEEWLEIGSVQSTDDQTRGYACWKGELCRWATHIYQPGINAAFSNVGVPAALMFSLFLDKLAELTYTSSSSQE